MGLDAYAYKTETRHATEAVDFVVPEHGLQLQIAYWRKHHDLQRWMGELYRIRGGKNDTFNGVNLRIDENDLDDLKRAMVSDYWIESHLVDDAKFIIDAREAIGYGLAVYYCANY